MHIQLTKYAEHIYTAVFTVCLLMFAIEFKYYYISFITSTINVELSVEIVNIRMKVACCSYYLNVS